MTGKKFLPRISALSMFFISQASSPIWPFRTLPDLKLLGKPATAETNFGLALIDTVSFEVFPTLAREAPLELELEQLYNPLTMERDNKRP
jgi:hypothetical protein